MLVTKILFFQGYWKSAFCSEVLFAVKWYELYCR